MPFVLMIDERWLLDVAQSLVPGDPNVTDYGALAAAVARHRHDVMGTLVYDGPHERAAALLHSLVRVSALESGNELFAAQVAYAYLHASGIPVKVAGPVAIRLIDDVLHGRCDVRQVTEALKGWA
ncbi:fic family toxin-antitoxin system, toxin component [Streptomyces sp. NPDC059271]|uniref:fic family toxin-antitoxin system, toxin component n=1 Tax=Streptomyces sp. NPDC059271 TaxID=3346799 RepID=UPI0036C94ECB